MRVHAQKIATFCNNKINFFKHWKLIYSLNIPKNYNPYIFLPFSANFPLPNFGWKLKYRGESQFAHALCLSLRILSSLPPSLFYVTNSKIIINRWRMYIKYFISYQRSLPTKIFRLLKTWVSKFKNSQKKDSLVWSCFMKTSLLLQIGKSLRKIQQQTIKYLCKDYKAQTYFWWWQTLRFRISMEQPGNKLFCESKVVVSTNV